MCTGNHDLICTGCCCCPWCWVDHQQSDLQGVVVVEVFFLAQPAGEGGLVPGARGVSVFQVNDVYLLSRSCLLFFCHIRCHFLEIDNIFHTSVIFTLWYHNRCDRGFGLQPYIFRRVKRDARQVPSKYWPVYSYSQWWLWHFWYWNDDWIGDKVDNGFLPRLRLLGRRSSASSWGWSTLVVWASREEISLPHFSIFFFNIHLSRVKIKWEKYSYFHQSRSFYKCDLWLTSVLNSQATKELRSCWTEAVVPQLEVNNEHLVKTLFVSLRNYLHYQLSSIKSVANTYITSGGELFSTMKISALSIINNI